MTSAADLYGRYAHLYDDGRADEFASLFTADALFTVVGREPVRGRTAIAEAARRGVATLPGVRHLISSVAIDTAPDGATATGRAYVQAVQVDGDSVRLVTLGRYTDRLVLHDGRWLIADHRYEPFSGEPARHAVRLLRPELLGNGGSVQSAVCPPSIRCSAPVM